MPDRRTEARTILRPTRTQDDARVVEIWNNVDPDLPPRSVEQFREMMRPNRIQSRPETWVLEVEEEVLGCALLSCNRRGSSSYYVTLLVEPTKWGQGIGARLWELILERVQDVQARRVLAEVREQRPHAERFMRHRGFVATGRGENYSRLTVATATLEGYEGVTDRLAREGIRVIALSNAGPANESLLHQLYHLDTVTHQDIPSTEPFEPRPYQDWLARSVYGIGRSADSCWIALDGERPVGLARLARHGNIAWNAFTGVHPQYRGRGIARALKLRTIDWSRRNGIDFHYTGNEVANQRMLDINRRLGYETLPASKEMMLDLATRPEPR